MPVCVGAFAISSARSCSSRRRRSSRLRRRSSREGRWRRSRGRRLGCARRPDRSPWLATVALVAVADCRARFRSAVVPGSRSWPPWLPRRSVRSRLGRAAFALARRPVARPRPVLASAGHAPRRSRRRGASARERLGRLVPPRRCGGDRVGAGASLGAVAALGDDGVDQAGLAQASACPRCPSPGRCAAARG